MLVAASSYFSSLCLRKRNHHRFRAINKLHEHMIENNGSVVKKKKVIVVGSGWAGLASAHHLSKQGFDVTVLEPENCPNEEVGLKGFWSPYCNIFSVVNELGLKPFTDYIGSALYTPEGLEVEFPKFHDLPRLPAPLSALLYPTFSRLGLEDRLTSLPLLTAVIDFDNTDAAWRKYDTMTARELFKKFGCSERVFHRVFEPLLHAGLFAPAEQCSAAATLAMMYYYVLAHQQNFDAIWCRGTVRDKIFIPWIESMKSKGCKFLQQKNVTDVILNDDRKSASGVIVGSEKYDADSVILAVGLSTLQSIVSNSSVLKSRTEFLNVLNLATIDVVSVKVWLDKKVKLPKACNIVSGFDDFNGLTFLDLSSIYEEYEDEPATILEAHLYCANQLLPLKDEQIVANLMSNLSRCIQDFEEVIVLKQTIVRLPKSATHFFPGSYKYMMRGSTTIPNIFMAGDWIVNRHGSWSQEKAYVTGLEAANRVIDYVGEGEFAKILPVEDDEPHIETLREVNRRVTELSSQLPFCDFFLTELKRMLLTSKLKLVANKNDDSTCWTRQLTISGRHMMLTRLSTLYESSPKSKTFDRGYNGSKFLNQVD